MSEKKNTSAAEESIEERDPLTPEGFSFVDVVLERDYPKDTVTVYMDEVSAIKLDKVVLKINALPDDAEDDVLNDLIAEAKRYQDKIDASAYEFHISGVGDDTVSGLHKIASDEFEDKKRNVKTASGRLERILPDSEQAAYLRYFNALTLAVHIEKIVQVKSGRAMLGASSEDGVYSDSELSVLQSFTDEVATFMDSAPTAEKIKLQQAIQNLRASSELFEQRIDADFLAKR